MKGKPFADAEVNKKKAKVLSGITEDKFKKNLSNGIKYWAGVLVPVKSTLKGIEDLSLKVK